MKVILTGATGMIGGLTLERCLQSDAIQQVSGFHTFRPGYIYPVTPRAEPNFSYRLMRWL